MKVYVHGPYNDVTKIEFCCSEMSEDILLGKVKVYSWTHNRFKFCVGDYKFNYCGHCGARIEVELFEK